MRKCIAIILSLFCLLILMGCGKNETITSEDTINPDEIIIYNGKEYKTSELCNQTLNWLNLPEKDRLISSYFPPEFLIIEEKWGVTLAPENVSPTGMTICCTQTGGEPTGSLQTGSWYIVENWTQETGWREVEQKPRKYELAWTAEAWQIPTEDTVEWKVIWEGVYGELPEGKYRIGKEIIDFRKSGDYDKCVYYAEFNIAD